MLVMIEGADYASALCLYLKEFENYKHLKVIPGRPIHKQLMEWEGLLAGNTNVAIEGTHLAAIDRGLYTTEKARMIDKMLAELNFRLVWAIGESERFNMTRSYVGTAYFHSQMSKIIFVEGKPITTLVKWLNGDSNYGLLQSS